MTDLIENNDTLLEQQTSFQEVTDIISATRNPDTGFAIISHSNQNLEFGTEAFNFSGKDSQNGSLKAIKVESIKYRF